MRLALLFQRGKVTNELARVLALQADRNVVGLIQMLDSDVRGLTPFGIVRDHAVAALGRLGDPRATPHIVEMRHDPEKMVRMSVMSALAQLKGKEAEAVVVEGLSDPAPIVRMSAAEALGRMGAVDAIQLLWNTVESDPDSDVRLSAVESLVILGDNAARDRVPEALGAVPRRRLGLPRYKRLREVAETGEALTPWVDPWE